MIAGSALLVEAPPEIQLLPDQTRFISTPNMSMVIPVYVFWGYTLLALSCVIDPPMSRKETLVAILN